MQSQSTAVSSVQLSDEDAFVLLWILDMFQQQVKTTLSVLG